MKPLKSRRRQRARSSISKMVIKKIDQAKSKYIEIGTLISAIFIALNIVFILWNILSLGDNARLDRDFIAFYSAATLIPEAPAKQLYNLETMHAAQTSILPGSSTFAWFYPPTYLLIISWLDFFDYKTAYCIFIALQTLALALAIRSVMPEIKKTHLAILTIGFPGLLINTIYGQNSILTAALFLSGISLTKNKPYISGILLGLISIKPQLVVLTFAFLIATRQIACLGSLLATSFTLILISLIYGTDSWLAFFSSINQASNYANEGRLPWDQMTSALSFALQLNASIKGAQIFHITVSLLHLILLTIICRRKYDPLLISSALALTTLSISPHAFDYELAWLIIPSILIWKFCENKKDYRLRPLAAALWLFPFLNSTILNYHNIPSFTPILTASAMLLIIALAPNQENGKKFD